ncbi:hypothetical protein PHYPSEUDO_012150 [Phytophthora pseudosyringae]|uniref:Uncharacterized protein n=1 Tax=Phytophthora pseudosyringae TaxID=221518 RepID=A0A8T1VC66_9STRA|nr:hypothetical protein PHYPSEUDO_012150 [Phytophthora pseudosyringae]
MLEGILLSARQRHGKDGAGQCDEIVSPYGRMPRKTRYRHQPSDSALLQAGLRFKTEGGVRRKRCRKLDPMPAVMPRLQGLTTSMSGNQTSGGDAALETPDEQNIKKLRSGLQENSSKLQLDAARLKHEIQWIHGHFPVLKLANSKCSRSLRQQLFRNAVVHVSINFMLRKALLFWYQKLLDVQRKERLQLGASRQLVAMFEKVSLDRVAGKFDSWSRWVLECQAQENLAAAVTLQHFARFLRARREDRECAERQVTLKKAVEELSRNAKTIQRAYRRHRRKVQQRRCEAAARIIQRNEMRRTAHNGFSKRQNAAKSLQRNYRAHSKRCSRERARAIAQLFDRNREKNARCIQSAWRGFKSWRESDLPVQIVRTLVDQVEFLDAVLSIQRHLRGFQCRFRIRKKNFSAARIQTCWRAGKRRVDSRAERRVLLLRRDLAASCLQHTFRRTREERKVRGVLCQSTRPLYLRARHLGNSFREQFRLPIAKSAIVMIQSTWRRHVACEKEKKRKLVAATTIRRFLKRGAILSKWRSSVLDAPRCRRDQAARTLQRWIRHRHTHSTRQTTFVVYVLEQIQAATKIQLWYRRRRCDLWRILLARLLASELPRCIDAVKRIGRCWKAYCTRKQEHTRRARTLADLIERQRRAEVENRAARFIQRMFQRMIGKRDGKLLLHRYRILLREDIKRKQQRVVVHNYLEEKCQQRKKKQGAAATGPRVSVQSSIGSTQVLSLDSCTTEASTFSLDEEIPCDSGGQGSFTEAASPQTGSPVQYWSEEYQQAYLYDPATGDSTWL